MAVAQHNISDYLEAAHTLAARVATAADRIDHEREIPSELTNEIADKGLFRMLVPRSLGGGELDFLDYLRIIEVFAEVDASTAWCINQNNVFATNSARMPEQTAREIWSDQRAVVTNGPPATSVEAIPVDGGYQLTGRWNFSTGIRHATWVAAITPIRYTDHNEENSVEEEEVRVLLMPKKDVNLIDNWQVNGLRGTGSFGFETEALFVPRTRTYKLSDSSREDGALYVIPIVLLFGAGFATAALGVARASLDAAIDFAVSKPQGRDREMLGDRSTTQRQVGEAEALWNSVRAFLRESISSVWESARNNHSLTTEERVRLRLASTHAIRTAAEVVDIAYNICSSSSIFATNPIQRRFQDAHVLTQQGQGRMAHYDTAGQFFLGLNPDGLF